MESKKNSIRKCNLLAVWLQLSLVFLDLSSFKAYIHLKRSLQSWLVYMVVSVSKVQKQTFIVGEEISEWQLLLRHHYIWCMSEVVNFWMARGYFYSLVAVCWPEGAALVLWHCMTYHRSAMTFNLVGLLTWWHSCNPGPSKAPALQNLQTKKFQPSDYKVAIWFNCAGNWFPT